MSKNLNKVFDKILLARKATQKWTAAASQLGPADSEFKDPKSLSLINFATPNELANLTLASDSDIGGSSHIDLTLNNGDEYTDGSWDMQGLPHAILSGRISLAVREEIDGKIRGGYVGFRTKPQPGVFSVNTIDIARHTHLSVICKPMGDPRLWPHWFINVQTDGWVAQDLWSHRLGITGRGTLGGGWEECQIPLTSLVHTHLGRITDRQVEPDLSRTKTIGLSLLGAPRADPNRATPEDAARAKVTPEGVEGHFGLAIGRVEAIYKHPHFVSFLPPTYSSPPSTAHFYPTPPVPTRYPSFAEANYRPTDVQTFPKGQYPPYEPKPLEIEGSEQERPKAVTDGGSRPPRSASQSEPKQQGNRRKRTLGLDREQTAKKLEDELENI
ncbi:NADH:ubiquinone oxidoreductase intermediate-associated protein 30 [Phaffia rhodozyma]|uniref:NADH:ubiquinone oxidoreductase intermediate-associated protein 30 n=1 Tax=Phaffia rhodozyma TaxID=264483 RepID=A0A0F7SUK3_PHARH|nr:NADH:ubiquinone oxidoreductase intermediate-associated protein 30 [Phaffia rhodozyma]